MPLKECVKNGVKGWSWGNAACMTGPDGKKKAIKMGLAIEGPSKFKKEVSKSSLSADPDVQEALASLGESPRDRLLGGVASQLEGEADQAVGYISQEERDKVPAADFGSPKERKFPVRNQHDLDSAAKLIGRAPPSAQMSIKQRIKEIAKRKGLKLPESWGTKSD